MKQGAVVCGVLLAAGLISGCATSGAGRQAAQSGFLGDYSQLQPGAPGQAQLRYVAPDVRIGAYDKIIIDPITVYAADTKGSLNSASRDDLQRIVDYLYATVQTHLVDDYSIVKEVGPGTMRLRIAVTEAQGAEIPLNLRSAGLPVGLGGGPLQKLTQNNPSVSRAGIEMELVDAQTGKRLLAAVDSRTGSREDSFSKLQGIQEAYDYWALRLKQQLAVLRAK